jgi:hypothetical protein
VKPVLRRSNVGDEWNCGGGGKRTLKEAKSRRRRRSYRFCLLRVKIKRKSINKSVRESEKK